MNSIEKEPQIVDIFNGEMENLFKSEGKVYVRKIEPIKGARQVTENAVIETRLKDGNLESTQEAKPGDWVITGSTGEEFVFTNSKFVSLYEEIGDGIYIPRERKIVAIPNPLKQSVRISAPWGTLENQAFQDGEEVCMFVAELNMDGEMTKDRYISGNEQMLLNNYTPEA